MKINITTDGGTRILLWFPTRQILNRLTVGISVACINKKNRKNGNTKITYRQFMPLVKEIHRQRRRRDEKWVLVDVESASGEKVRIIL
jgi:hypothetical protein